MIKQLIAVGIGGAVGSMLRFLVSVATTKVYPGTFPLPTLLVNLSGCLLIGLFAGLLADSSQAHANLRFLLITGFCGGYTTFSAFANENLLLIQNNQLALAITYTLVSVVMGIAAVWAGLWISKLV